MIIFADAIKNIMWIKSCLPYVVQPTFDLPAGSTEVPAAAEVLAGAGEEMRQSMR